MASGGSVGKDSVLFKVLAPCRLTVLQYVSEQHKLDLGFSLFFVFFVWVWGKFIRGEN